SKSKVQGLEDFVIGSNPMLEVVESTKHPLYITDPEANAGNVDIQLHNWSPETRVCVIATKFVPYEGTLFEHLNAVENAKPWAMNKTELTPISFKTGRVLGEEYQYILNRKAHNSRWAGNLLTKPSALLSPWSVAETTMSKEEMKDERVDDVELMNTHHYFGGGGRPLARKARFLPFNATSMESCPPHLLNFLVHPSVTLINLTPDPSTGSISIPYSTFKEGTFLQIFALDGHQAVQQSFVVPRPASDPLEFQRRDLRFSSKMIHTKHYIGERTGVELDPKLYSTVNSAGISTASVTLASNGSSSSAVRVINSIKQVYDLMLTLLPTEEAKQTLREFGVVTDWHNLSSPLKRDKLSKLTSHEFHLFLYKKDRVFFDAVIAPFLKNKLVKSFMDDYLIGASLEKYVSLDEFKRLTCMEKCLLAQRIPRLKAAVARWVKDRTHHTRNASNVKLFLTVMNSGSLKETAPGAGGDGFDVGVCTTEVYKSASENEKEESRDEDTRFELMEPDETTTTTTAKPMVSFAAPSSASQKTNVVAERERSEKLLQSQFKPVDLTKEMAETYYYGRQDFKASGDDDANLFWLDLVQWDESKGGSFLSQNFVANTGSFTNAMATIALLDVAFQPKDALLTRSSTHNLMISSQSPAIVFHSSTK
ncbi:hypothetical protein BGX27_003995, partial [Mortierella sp. AM989]